jgi:hypothetical protein
LRNFAFHVHRETQRSTENPSLETAALKEKVLAVMHSERTWIPASSDQPFIWRLVEGCNGSPAVVA